MQGTHLFQKALFCFNHRCDGLPRAWLGSECDKIARMAGGQNHPNFTTKFGASYTRPMTSTGINDDKRLGPGIGRVLSRWFDTQQGIINRRLKITAIQNQLMLKYQHGGFTGTVMLNKLIAALEIGRASCRERGVDGGWWVEW